MTTYFERLRSLTFGLVLAASLSRVAMAQEEMKAINTGTPRYVVLPAKPGAEAAPAGSLTTWNGSFVYKGKTYTYNMVGLDPTTGSSVTIPVVIIPVKIVITKRGKKTTFDPEHVLSNGKTVVANTLASPIFDFTTTYVQGGVDVGTTQYEDAFQRANFWGIVQNNPGYHVLLSTTTLAEQTLSPPTRDGTTGAPFGTTVAEVNINWFDAQVNTLITKLGITSNQFPIFLTYDTYLTQGGCCIGGYHSATGSQSYTNATYVDAPGEFAQDVSALSHEVGEWLDDPLVANSNGNQTPCGILENGDPLENNANFGGYPYTVNGFTYNLQDLTTLPYFGAPPSTSVNGFFTFQGENLSVCQNGS